ncbi:MAG: Glyoxalase/bleomycin resistance protein/dioxygenase [Candidatus Kaiserbacteria bacterium]|nr:Glyoxalase/bleomycin resistance protein/dioxygenase [Candidatus Kaiserbacteria bacterium]
MAVHKEVTIGHVHLTVSDLERSLSFYRDILGFEVTARFDSAAFLSAGGYHHHIGLNTWAGAGASRPPAGRTGLYHFAILYPTRRELALALRSLGAAEYPLTGSADHGVSEAIYLDDPDGNGVELYVDRPRSEWKVSNDGKVEMITAPLDIEDLLKAADS